MSIGLFEPPAENHPARIGHITLDVKHTGKPSAGNLHAGFDEAGAGNQMRHRAWRQSSTLLMLIGRDYHPSFQAIAFFVEDTGEYGKQGLNYGGGQADRSYRRIKRTNGARTDGFAGAMWG